MSVLSAGAARPPTSAPRPGGLMAPTTAQLVIGVDTHADRHVAVALDTLGRHLATASFAASDTGNARLLAWACQHGRPVAAGVEGTGSFGYRLPRYLLAHGVAVREVNRPDRARRRRVGKNDPLDAEHAARAVLAGDASAIPKNRDGVVGELRCLVGPAAARSRPAPGHQPAPR